MGNSVCWGGSCYMITSCRKVIKNNFDNQLLKHKSPNSCFSFSNVCLLVGQKWQLWDFQSQSQSLWNLENCVGHLTILWHFIDEESNILSSMYIKKQYINQVSKGNTLQYVTSHSQSPNSNKATKYNTHWRKLPCLAVFTLFCCNSFETYGLQLEAHIYSKCLISVW